VTGAHLHWTVRLNGTRVDPLSLMDALSGLD
jgi:murein DD-endopeptidase MepM/ murein hydrolase activator NlpD